ncbi:MAG: pimeloyl-ACP methyl esterase BioG family protein [Ruegeria sp.]
MRRHWLAQKGGPELTLVFGGWALGPTPFEGLRGAGDVLFLDDYRDINDDVSETAQYDRTRVLAYSFGVASAAHWLGLTSRQTSRLAAVNGTLYPADEHRGIAPDTVAATADGLNEASFARFCRRAGFDNEPPALDIPAAQAELRMIAERGPAPTTAFDRIWISDRDRIIPRIAQDTAWSEQADAVRHIPGSHQPFVAGQTWQEWFT